jgi:hypothetical protein
MTAAQRLLAPADFKRIALSFPEAHEKLSYGEPSIFIVKRFFTRLRKEDHGIVLLVDSIDEREMLLEADPEVYFMTDHYKNYPYVLARLGKIDEATLVARLERIWQKIAPTKLVKARMAMRGGSDQQV